MKAISWVLLFSKKQWRKQGKNYPRSAPITKKKTKILISKHSFWATTSPFTKILNATNTITSIIAISEESRSYSYNSPSVFTM